MKWAGRSYIDKAPIWCSVDLRDGNQALVVPMSLSQKLEFFSFLCKIGFKEIEIGFPAASSTEYDFCRTLIEKDLIPADVTIQVLTQSREPIIEKTVKALSGAKNAIIHFYNSTSAVQREQVFCKSRQEIIDIAVQGAKLIKQFGDFQYQYSPESFTGTEPEFALEICNEVLEVLQPSRTRKVIINLPGTVEVSMPHVYASQIEYMCENLKKRENVVVSIHPHNDRGCAVADAEMGILAGADRVEGTLFGNGERTGNADLITLALNMYSQGVDPLLELNNIPDVAEIYERLTGMDVHSRHPYCGELVFAAFSGSHQDAIAKSMKFREESAANLRPEALRWRVPYLPVDPDDLGRRYDIDVIRINSQSGKGGIGYILKRSGVELPARMRESAGYAVKGVSDKLKYKELCADEVYNAFCEAFVNIESPVKLLETHFKQNIGEFEATVTLNRGVVTGSGNGRLDAVSEAIKKCLEIKFSITFYSEHAMEVGSNSQAMSYIEITDEQGESHWGAGLHTDIITSSALALVSAINRSMKK
jgi:2-isopropylmalate synthase